MSKYHVKVEKSMIIDAESREKAKKKFMEKYKLQHLIHAYHIHED